jgi:hypothetical protein
MSNPTARLLALAETFAALTGQEVADRHALDPGALAAILGREPTAREWSALGSAFCAAYAARRVERAA